MGDGDFDGMGGVTGLSAGSSTDATGNGARKPVPQVGHFTRFPACSSRTSIACPPGQVTLSGTAQSPVQIVMNFVLD